MQNATALANSSARFWRESRRMKPCPAAVLTILFSPTFWLRRLAPQIAHLAAPGADIILSGLLPSEAAGVAGAYNAQGMALLRRIKIEGWATLLMRRHRGR